MNKLIKMIEDGNERKESLQFNVGDSVKVHNLIKEGEKERVQMFEGVVTKKQGVALEQYFEPSFKLFTDKLIEEQDINPKQKVSPYFKKLTNKIK